MSFLLQQVLKVVAKVGDRTIRAVTNPEPRYTPPRSEPSPYVAARPEPVRSLPRDRSDYIPEDPLVPYVRYAQHLAQRLREHRSVGLRAVPPGEHEAFVGGLRELMERRIAPGTSPARVHRRLLWLKSFELEPNAVAEVLGTSDAVEAYFAARAAGGHLFDELGVCAVCDADSRTAPGRCNG